MWVSIVTVVVIFIIFFLAMAFVRGVSLHKTDEEYMRDDLEQAEYMRKWAEEKNDKKKSSN